MVVVVFRARLKPDADQEELGRLGKRMFDIASSMPGYISYKDFAAGDGESVSIVEFESLGTLADWRDHPEHKAVQERGRQEFFLEYFVQVCTLVRQSDFRRAPGKVA
jgi:heme-degrading monooxygenase HmoA